MNPEHTPEALSTGPKTGMAAELNQTSMQPANAAAGSPSHSSQKSAAASTNLNAKAGEGSPTNLNDMARELTLQEGLKEQLSIGQVKEVLRLTLLRLKQMPLGELTKLLERVK